MFNMISSPKFGATKRDALVKSVSAVAVAMSVAFAGVPSALAAQDGINRLIAVQQMKADAAGAEGAEDLQAKEGQAEEAQKVEELQMMEMPSNEESQHRDLRSGTGKAESQQLWRKQ